MKFDVEKALQHRVVLLSGKEHSLRREALTDLILAAGAGDDFDLETFGADASTPLEWIGAASTAPFLSPKRTAIVRNILREAEPSLFADCFKVEGSKKLKELPESALIILVADDETGDDGKQQKLARLAESWEKTIKGIGGLVCKLEVPGEAIIQRIRADCTERGKAMSSSAATLLKEMCGDSYSRARDELEKLLVFVGEAPSITEQHVREAVFGSREWNVFKLTDAVIKRNQGEALRQLAILIGSNAKAEGMAFSSILPQLSRQMRLLYQARTLIENGCDVSSVPESVKALLPSRGNLLSEKDFPKRLAMQGAKHLSSDQIVACFQILADTDARLKGNLAGYSARDTLERMVLEMIEQVEPRRIA